MTDSRMVFQSRGCALCKVTARTARRAACTHNLHKAPARHVSQACGVFREVGARAPQIGRKPRTHSRTIFLDWCGRRVVVHHASQAGSGGHCRTSISSEPCVLLNRARRNAELRYARSVASCSCERERRRRICRSPADEALGGVSAAQRSWWIAKLSLWILIAVCECALVRGDPRWI